MVDMVICTHLWNVIMFPNLALVVVLYEVVLIPINQMGLLQDMKHKPTTTEIPDDNAYRSYSLRGKREVISSPNSGIQFVRGPPGPPVSNRGSVMTVNWCNI